MDKRKICFLADKHDLFDDRIYWKMAVPLKEKGYDVYYVLIRDEIKKGITKEGIKYDILKVKTFSKNRYLNFILKNINPSNNYKKLFKKATKINADVYHFHDLWINKIGKKLKSLPQKPVVIYDVHEPFAIDIKDDVGRHSKIKWLMNLYVNYIDSWEKKCAKRYDFIITTEENVRDSFRKVISDERVEVIYNFTDLYKDFTSIPLKNKEYDFIYCGGATESRGVIKILEAVKIAKKNIPNIKVVFVGRYTPSTLKLKLQKFINSNDLKNNVQLIPFVKYAQVSDFYNKSKVGLITWQPAKALSIKMPIKIFEYMAFALPIIGSNFGHIKEYIKKENCGITVDPNSPEEISNAMITLLTDSNKYNVYSKNGRKATLEKYKWDFEFKRLIGFYTKALNEREKNINNVK